jgi:predicted phage replisome organizer
MRERKYVKLRVDMYEDIKLKIIDKMEDRDLIQYIWTRFITLAGKVNLDGSLYISKNIPYTVDTLAIEFNRSVEKVKLALGVLKDLEMIEVTENNVYRIKNFVTHQNIKVKEKVKNVDNNRCIICEGNNESIIDEDNKEEIITKESMINKDLQNKICEEIKIKCEDGLDKDIKIKEIQNEGIKKSSLINKNIDVKKGLDDKEKIEDDINLNKPIVLDNEKGKKRRQSGKKNAKYKNNIESINDCTEYVVEDSVWGEVLECEGDTKIFNIN